MRHINTHSSLRMVFLTAIFLLLGLSASAQKYSVGVDPVTAAAFGTLNIHGGVAVAKEVSLEAEVRYNPFSYKKKDGSQMQYKQQTYTAGVRWWPWYCYSGWFFGAAAQYQEYNRGGILSPLTEEGDAVGLAVSGGYMLMLSKHVNLEFGIGVWGGHKWYTAYSCPRCGRIVDEGRKWFVAPNDLSVAVVFVF